MEQISCVLVVGFEMLSADTTQKNVFLVEIDCANEPLLVAY